MTKVDRIFLYVSIMYMYNIHDEVILISDLARKVPKHKELSLTSFICF